MAGSLDLLPFQPTRFGMAWETCANNDNRGYCQLLQDGDELTWQVKRLNGVGTNLGCSLLEVSATQLLANNTFTGSELPWVLVNWTYGANAVSIAAAAGSVTQTLAALIPGAMYKIEIITTATLLTNDIVVSIGGDAVGTIPATSVAGTYTFYGIAGTLNSDIAITNASAATCTVTSISLYRVAPCYIFTLVSGTYTYDPVNGLTVSGTMSIEVDLTLEPATPYSVQTAITMSDVSGGDITVGYSADILPTEEASNGINYFTNNDTTYGTSGITLQNFIGTINSITFVQLYTEYVFSLQDMDGVFVANLNPFITFCREWIYGTVNFENEGYDYGCYRIALYDPALHIAEEIEFSYDFTTLGVPWTETPGADWTLGATGYVFVSSGASGSIATAENVASSFTPAWIKARFETGATTGAFTHVVNVGDGVYNEPFNGAVTAANTIYRYSGDYDPQATWDTSLTHSIQLFGTDDAIILNSYFKIYVYSEDHLSNCINFKQEHSCTKAFYGLPGVNMGFNSTNCGFAFQQRFRCAFINPEYNIKGTDFISSDGIRVLISGNLQKVKTLVLDYMDEYGHDSLAGFKMCREVYIGDTFSSLNTRYFIFLDNYKPDWEKDGKLNLAMGRILLIEYDQVKFVTNCG